MSRAVQKVSSPNAPNRLPPRILTEYNNQDRDREHASRTEETVDSVEQPRPKTMGRPQEAEINRVGHPSASPNKILSPPESITQMGSTHNDKSPVPIEPHVTGAEIKLSPLQMLRADRSMKGRRKNDKCIDYEKHHIGSQPPNRYSRNPKQMPIDMCAFHISLESHRNINNKQASHHHNHSPPPETGSNGGSPSPFTSLRSRGHEENGSELRSAQNMFIAH
ncbi:hypothetical protein CcaCcLH18_14351 [Colletotrichum camelliae]|nr:hypothetical protein CcaCcLH18_14351 [Colletotrichum camelliae]